MAASSAEEQSSILEEAFGFVAEQRFYLRKAIQHNDMEMALRYGLCLANELRSSKLLPENYYRLYALVFWELQHLAEFVADTERHGLDVAEVYELVQYEGNVLPRLYLLVTVGAVQARCADGSSRDVLDDLASMLGAVQHPVRGLFLRHFLLQMVKDKLPGLRGARRGLQYLLANLRESASLWARLRLEEGRRAEGAGGAGERGEGTWRLDRGRHALRLLLGAQILHLARLPALTAELHAEVLLPEALRLSTGCEDAAGRAHLLQCFVEALPERFHLLTLERVLAACAQVHWAADLRPLLQQLLRRLTAHLAAGAAAGGAAAAGAGGAPGARPEAGAGAGGPAGAPAGAPAEAPAEAPGAPGAPFDLVLAHLRRLHARPRSPALPLASLLELQLELALSALALHPGDAARLELVLAGAAELLERRLAEGEGLEGRAVQAAVGLLAAPLAGALAPRVLALPHHGRLMALLGRGAQREAALAMLSALLGGDVALSDCETLRRLLELVDRLVRDEGGSGGPGAEPGADAGASDAWRHLEHDSEAFVAEQEKVARLVHQVRHADPGVTFRMLNLLRGFFDKGGPHRIVFTLPALVVAALRLASHVLDATCGDAPSGRVLPRPSIAVDRIFTFSHALCARLSPLAPEESLRLWLLCASATERAVSRMGEGDGLSATCYRFMESGLDCLETAVCGSEARFRGLQLLVGTLRQLTCLRGAKYELAAERVVQLGSQFPSMRLQSRAFCLCSGLFWGPACQQPSRTLACLRGSLRFADSAIHVDPMDVSLFVEVLDEAVHHFGQGNEEITAPFLSGLLALCVQHLRYIESRAPVEALRGLHVALADLREKQSRAQARASPGAPGAAEPQQQPRAGGAPPEPAPSARYAELRLQVAVAPAAAAPAAAPAAA